MRAGLRVREGGSGEPVLLLLHGLGATGDVWEGWRPLLARRWLGRWLAPDLPGHGGSQPLPGYAFESLAAAVARVVSTSARTVVLGHSLGGVVGLALASGVVHLARGGCRPLPAHLGPGRPAGRHRPGGRCDQFVLLACTLLGAMLTVLGNLLADITLMIADLHVRLT